MQTFLTDFKPLTVSNTEKLRVWKTTLTILNKLDSTMLEEIPPEKIGDEINETSEFLQEIDRVTVKIDITLEKISNASNPATQVGTLNFPLSSENVNNNVSPLNNEILPLKYKQMLKSFKTELEARERCFHMQSNQKEKHDRSKFNTKQEQSTTSLLAQRVEQPTITCLAITCSYCLGKHTAGRCNIVTNVKQLLSNGKVGMKLAYHSKKNVHHSLIIMNPAKID